MLFYAGMLFIGLAAGIASGAMGIGGAVIIIPFLVYIGGMSQKMAQGTTLLLMLPPIGILAAWQYLRRGEADWQAALWICMGFLVGGYVGAKMIADVPPVVLKRALGFLLLAVSVKIIIKP
ncbi:sulfite exporter TauE/SafE family protein [candidate division FCPU426 bacterium]|nr:sulfite exporter TauE/SafE family protein [candidate division FCPU426 bacterium]